MDNYQSPSFAPSVKRTRFEPHGTQNEYRKNTAECFRCGKIRHTAKTCWGNSVRCYLCRGLGHKKESCPRSQAANKEKSSHSKEVKLIDAVNSNNSYFKWCEINGTRVFAYVDTGSQVNIIANKVVERMTLPTKPNINVLRGFGGQETYSKSESSFMLKIDEIYMGANAVVTNANMEKVEIIIGQPIINHHDVSFIVTQGTCKLLEFITLPGDGTRPTAVLEEDVSLKAESVSSIKINIVNVGDGEVLLNANSYQVGTAYIYVPGGIYKDPNSITEVLNLGDNDVFWQRGKVVARGHSCTSSTVSADRKRARDFSNMSDDEKCLLKWKYLMERCAICIAVVFAGNQYPVVSVLHIRLANSVEVGRRLPVY